MYGPKYCIVTRLPTGLIYIVEKMAESGRLEAVVVQKSNPKSNNRSSLRNVARKMRNLFYDPRKRQAAVLRALLPGFTDFHVLDNQIEKKLTLLAKKHDFDLLFTTSINVDTQIHNYLKNSQSRYALVMGGKILKPVVLSSFEGMWINCHGGFLPYYRGLCSEYWAIKNREFDKIGWTIHELVERIDAGKIFEKGTVPYDPNETLEELMKRNHAAMIIAYIKFAEALPDSVTRAQEHRPEKANYYSRPKDCSLRKLMRMKVCQL